MNAVVFLGVLAIWASIAPGVTGAGAAMWLAFVLGQAYVLARLLMKLHFLASATAMFQHSLAHASYTAAPSTAWPDSPAADAISVRQPSGLPTRADASGSGDRAVPGWPK